MLNFTVGPVQSFDEICQIGAEQVPYFRTEEFSIIMLENEKYMKELSGALDSSRVVFITGSGTASMEAAVMNTLNTEDKVLVVNGGSFGARFVQLCMLHDIPFTEIKPVFNCGISANDLSIYDNQGYTAFIVNIHETSTGVLHDIDAIAAFCRRNNLFLIVDAISAFLAEKINMSESGIDVLLTGSQKALACPPGVSIIVLSKKAQERINQIECKCMYLDLKLALLNGERGQTPFTPAVGILRQIHFRLEQICRNGGVEQEIERVSLIANDFRKKIQGLPFEIVPQSPSNAVTTLRTLTVSAHELFLILKNEYGIWVCPNGGELRDKIFRVGHIGNLTVEDNDILISAFKDIQRRGLI